MSGVKKCPFCGAPGKLRYDSGNEVWGQSWQCVCTKCAAETEKYFGSSSWLTKPKEDAKAKADALAAWNSRV